MRSVLESTVRVAAAGALLVSARRVRRRLPRARRWSSSRRSRSAGSSPRPRSPASRPTSGSRSSSSSRSGASSTSPWTGPSPTTWMYVYFGRTNCDYAQLAGQTCPFLLSSETKDPKPRVLYTETLEPGTLLPRPLQRRRATRGTGIGSDNTEAVSLQLGLTVSASGAALDGRGPPRPPASSSRRPGSERPSSGGPGRHGDPARPPGGLRLESSEREGGGHAARHRPVVGRARPPGAPRRPPRPAPVPDATGRDGPGPSSRPRAGRPHRTSTPASPRSRSAASPPRGRSSRRPRPPTRRAPPPPTTWATRTTSSASPRGG